MRSRTFAVALVGALSLTVACGGGGNDVARPDDDGIVRLTMHDNRYEPSEVRVEAGQRVVFRFENDGSVAHEAYIGDEAAQDAHAEAMTPETEMPGYDMDAEAESDPDHSSGDALRVEPGETGTLEHRFHEPGTVLIGCHEPGHWESGMRATVEVS